MASLEERLQNLILSRYPTMKAFAEACGIKYSTMLAIFSRGLKNTGTQNIRAICETLGISADHLNRGEILLFDLSHEMSSFRAEQNRLYNLMLDHKIEIDGICLSDEEMHLIDDMISAAADMVRKYRERHQPRWADEEDGE